MGTGGTRQSVRDHLSQERTFFARCSSSLHPLIHYRRPTGEYNTISVFRHRSAVNECKVETRGRGKIDKGSDDK